MRRFPRKSRKSRPRRLWPAYMLFAALTLGYGAVRSNQPPKQPGDICSIFEDKRGWYKAASASEQRWGTPKHVQMSIMHQESTFRFNARPPRTKLLGIIPWKRPTDAYGYAQALDATWDWYRKETGRSSADRDDFEDAIDFVGWYTHKSSSSAGISKWDPYNQYLAYHEGQSGWQSGTYRDKDWLKKSAQRVDSRARRWWTQLQSCEDKLNTPWWRYKGPTGGES